MTEGPETLTTPRGLVLHRVLQWGGGRFERYDGPRIERPAPTSAHVLGPAGPISLAVHQYGTMGAPRVVATVWVGLCPYSAPISSMREALMTVDECADRILEALRRGAEAR